MERGFSILIVLIAAGVLVVGGVGGYLIAGGNTSPRTSSSSADPSPTPILASPSPVLIPNVKACTNEAMICPDGSSVGRSGPNCEFAICPVSIVLPQPKIDGDMYTNWKTYTNSDSSYSIKYPEEIPLNSVSAPEYVSLFKSNESQTGYPFMMNIFLSDNKNGLSEKEFFVREWMKVDTEIIDQYSQIKRVKVGQEDALNIVLDIEKFSNSQGFSYYLISKAEIMIVIVTLEKGLKRENNSVEVKALNPDFTETYEGILQSLVHSGE